MKMLVNKRRPHSAYFNHDKATIRVGLSNLDKKVAASYILNTVAAYPLGTSHTAYKLVAYTYEAR